MTTFLLALLAGVLVFTVLDRALARVEIYNYTIIAKLLGQELKILVQSEYGGDSVPLHVSRDFFWAVQNGDKIYVKVYKGYFTDRTYKMIIGGYK